MASSVLLTLSCGTSDDSSSNNSNNNSSSKITPPAWIQGTWIKKGETDNVGYRFTSDDFCQLVILNEFCWKASMGVQNSDSSISQDISNTTYSIKYTAMGISSIFSFKQKSSSEIIWTNANGFDESIIEHFTYVKQ
ncbi:hypothetical protein MG290_01060 [Flavobacterium sp. CBA20B-1]|uniref:hypothetical protein n=1 Tax=unclassified Flavobacterium TaxID=196869 RepID=UPI002224BFE2|nr:MULTISPECIES: hypothetical protein [unclassified Flavobacterium]WCM42290.1 hypothetical protein MG290_01060 [Flavobacterium sp. CBA20B-1]